LLGDLCDRHALFDQGRKLLARNAATRRVLVVIRGHKPMLLDPVAHGRFVSSNSPPDLGQR
jgi:hypothetical protein